MLKKAAGGILACSDPQRTPRCGEQDLSRAP